MKKLLVVAAVAALALVAPPAATAADVTGSVTLTAPKSVGFGKSATLSGQVTVEGVAAGDSSLLFERKISGTGWERFATGSAGADGSFSVKVKVRSQTQFRVTTTTGPTLVSPVRTVKLNTGTAVQRALLETALKHCSKGLPASTLKAGVYIYGGPKAFKVVGKYARVGLACMDADGLMLGAAGEYWQKKGKVWKFYYGTQNYPECRKFDHKGWPMKVTGRLCIVVKRGKVVGEPRAIRR
ncbi:MAG: hypothetical protein FWD59_09385 [Micrococcales bacterium]|nr:hypothetical protein [Micrococcales bacterium]